MLILAIGSRGDVQPLSQLARGLVEAGQSVSMIAMQDYRDLVEASGAEFVPMRMSLSDTIPRSQPRALRPVAWSEFGQAFMLRRWMRMSSAAITEAIAGVIDDHDVILSGVMSATAGAALATLPGRKVATVMLTGTLPTGERASHMFGHRLTTSHRANLALTRQVWRVMMSFGAPVTRRLRQDLSLTEPSRPVLSHPLIVAASPVLVPPAYDWPSTVHQTGLLANHDTTGSLPAELERFLHDHPEPVYVGFGSMGEGLSPIGLDDIARAQQLTGLPVIAPAPSDGQPGRHADKLLTIAPVSHDLLLPRTRGVIHHGGVGTTHSGLRSGRPSMALPLGFDQPYHAWRLHQLGVGPRPRSLTTVTADGLAEVMYEMCEGTRSQRYRDRAEMVGAIVAGEDGVTSAIESLAGLGYLE